MAVDLESNLKTLMCGGKNPTSGQIYEHIVKRMREQDDVDNGLPPAGCVQGTGRVGQLQNLPPRYKQPAKDVGKTTYLVEKPESNLSINNNPLYPPNIVDRLFTPFDYIEEILLQDFSEQMGISSSSGNYFKDLFSISGNKIKKNGQFWLNDGPYVVDSFTYTPFIDYSLNENEGIYSDEFLNDFNSGRWNESYSGTNKREQVDKHRHDICGNLF